MSFEFLDARNPDVIVQTIASALKNKQKVIVIGAGEDGITGGQHLVPHPNLILCLTSHMVLERYRDPSLLEKLILLRFPLMQFLLKTNTL